MYFSVNLDHDCCDGWLYVSNHFYKIRLFCVCLVCLLIFSSWYLALVLMWMLDLNLSITSMAKVKFIMSKILRRWCRWKLLVSSKCETCSTICYHVNDLDCLFFKIEPSNENAFALVYLLLMKALTGILETCIIGMILKWCALKWKRANRHTKNKNLLHLACTLQCLFSS